jgi:hypothetical protein
MTTLRIDPDQVRGLGSRYALAGLEVEGLPAGLFLGALQDLFAMGFAFSDAVQLERDMGRISLSAAALGAELAAAGGTLGLRSAQAWAAEQNIWLLADLLDVAAGEASWISNSMGVGVRRPIATVRPVPDDVAIEKHTFHVGASGGVGIEAEGSFDIEIDRMESGQYRVVMTLDGKVGAGAIAGVMGGGSVAVTWYVSNSGDATRLKNLLELRALVAAGIPLEGVPVGILLTGTLPMPPVPNSVDVASSESKTILEFEVPVIFSAKLSTEASVHVIANDDGSVFTAEKIELKAEAHAIVGALVGPIVPVGGIMAAGAITGSASATVTMQGGLPQKLTVEFTVDGSAGGVAFAGTDHETSLDGAFEIHGEAVIDIASLPPELRALVDVIIVANPINVEAAVLELVQLALGTPADPSHGPLIKMNAEVYAGTGIDLSPQVKVEGVGPGAEYSSTDLHLVKKF